MLGRCGDFHPQRPEFWSIIWLLPVYHHELPYVLWTSSSQCVTELSHMSVSWPIPCPKTSLPPSSLHSGPADTWHLILLVCPHARLSLWGFLSFQRQMERLYPLVYLVHASVTAMTTSRVSFPVCLGTLRDGVASSLFPQCLNTH